MEFIQDIPWWWIVVGLGMFGGTLVWMSKEQKFSRRNWFKMETVARKDDPDLYKIEFVTFSLTTAALIVLALLKLFGA